MAHDRDGLTAKGRQSAPTEKAAKTILTTDDEDGHGCVRQGRRKIGHEKHEDRERQRREGGAERNRCCTLIGTTGKRSEF